MSVSAYGYASLSLGLQSLGDAIVQQGWAEAGQVQAWGAVTDSDQKTLWMTPDNPADSLWPYCGHTEPWRRSLRIMSRPVASCPVQQHPSDPRSLQRSSMQHPELAFLCHTSILTSPTPSQCRCSPTKSPLAVLSWAVALYLGNKRRGRKATPSSGRCSTGARALNLAFSTAASHPFPLSMNNRLPPS